jgi:hypothetical protein
MNPSAELVEQALQQGPVGGVVLEQRCDEVVEEEIIAGREVIARHALEVCAGAPAWAGAAPAASAAAAKAQAIGRLRQYERLL